MNTDTKTRMVLTKMSVLIATSGRTTRLELTLRSLLEARCPPIDVNIVVVENGSKEGAEDVIKKLPTKRGFSIHYFFEDKANKSSALNLGIDYIRSGFVVFFDDDLRFDPGILTSYYEAAMFSGEKRYYGGPFACDHDEAPPDWLNEFLPRSATGWQGVSESSAVDDWYYVGFNWGVFIEAIERAGPFSEEYGPGATTGATGQETEMQGRLASLGYKPAFVATAKVWHYVPKNRCSTSFALRRTYRNGVSWGMTYGQENNLQGKVPRWLYYRFAISLLKKVSSVATGSRQRKFKASYALQSVKGQIAGLKMQDK